jgi:hypothetical protein
MTQTVDITDISRSEILSRAADLVEGGWTKGNMALDGMGDAIDPLDFRACAFCAHGALVAAARKFYPEAAQSFLDEEVEAINETIIDLGLLGETGKLVTSYGANGVMHQWNDEAYRMSIDVVEMMRKAAEKIAAGAL